MIPPFKIRVLQLSMEPLNETVCMAQACEAAGFDVFWLAEAYPWWRKHSMEARSSTATTAIVARETKRIAIGWGIISPYTRHPVQIAMETRVLQEAAGEGRCLLGLGASKIFMKEIGEGEKGREVGPATVMRESIEIIKATLSGEEVKYEGKAFQAFAPALKPDALAQGLLTASITTPKFATYSRKVMEEGAKKASRDGSQLDLGCVVVGSVGVDPKTAREGAREMAAMYLANKVQNIMGSADTLLDCAGLTREELQPIADAMEKGGRKAAARAVSDAALNKVCPIAGSPKQCIERLEEYHAAGCTQMMLELWGDDRLQQARLFGEKVLPNIRAMRRQ